MFHFITYISLARVRVRTPPTSVSSQPPSSLKLCFTLCHCSFLEDIFGSQNSCSEICQGRAWRFGHGNSLQSSSDDPPKHHNTHTHTHSETTAMVRCQLVTSHTPFTHRWTAATAAATATHALRVCGPRARALSPLLQPAGACRWGLGIVDAVLF